MVPVIPQLATILRRSESQIYRGIDGCQSALSAYNIDIACYSDLLVKS